MFGMTLCGVSKNLTYIHIHINSTYVDILANFWLLDNMLAMFDDLIDSNNCN